jgi:hypothetical protein
MAVGISTTSTGEEDGSITPLVVGDGLVDDERAGWEPVLVVGARKAPRSRTIKMPRPARAVTAIEPIRPAVVEIRGSRRPRPLGATEERYAAKRESEPLSVSQCGRGGSTLPCNWVSAYASHSFQKRKSGDGANHEHSRIQIAPFRARHRRPGLPPTSATIGGIRSDRTSEFGLCRGTRRSPGVHPEEEPASGRWASCGPRKDSRPLEAGLPRSLPRPSLAKNRVISPRATEPIGVFVARVRTR